MTKFIFHGGGTRSASEGNNSFYAELVKNIPENGNVLFVYFASREEDNSKRTERNTNKCMEFAEGKKLQFAVATTEKFFKRNKNG